VQKLFTRGGEATASGQGGDTKPLVTTIRTCVRPTKGGCFPLSVDIKTAQSLAYVYDLADRVTQRTYPSPKAMHRINSKK
jgi:hypothetical protein